MENQSLIKGCALHEVDLKVYSHAMCPYLLKLRESRKI